VSPSIDALIRIGIDPVIRLGGLAIHWYGVMYAVAFWVGWRYAVSPHLARRGVPQATIDRMVTWTIVVGLVGARLYYVVQNTDQVHNPVDVIAVWNGGMAFFGAVIASLAALGVLAWRNRLSYWLVADAGVLFAVVGQPIGRIGNIINGDILGGVSSLPWATAYTYQTSPGRCAVLQPGFFCGVGYAPAAAYEAIGTILIGVVLFSLRHRGVRDGVLTISYVALYAISQLVIFVWRASEPAVLLGLKQAQWTAIGMLVVAVPGLVYLWRHFPELRAGPESGALPTAPEATG